MDSNHAKYVIVVGMGRRGIRGTVVAHWTTGQKVEWSILRQEHDSEQN